MTAMLRPCRRAPRATPDITGMRSPSIEMGETMLRFSMSPKCEVPSGGGGGERGGWEHREGGAGQREGRDHVALVDVTEVRGAVAALGGRVSFGHVLHHCVAGTEAAD